jgi:ATP-binding cassette subfamily B protein
MEITKVSLKNISFRFPGQRLFLSDISLDIGKGRLVALVGESGTGKSTLLNIIMKFYSPESGRIIINDDTDYEKILPGRWRDSVGLIPQDVHLFNGTILENIIPEPTEEKVNKLLKMTSDYGLDSFINSMPLGFATVTGEDGVKLSGGQKQVVAFMRALIKEPDILLIDEGTSGMDRDTEDHFLKILMRIRDETGILLVTHRINFIRKLCDYVYILEEGKIKTSGTHDDLICTDNIYKRFWEDFN